MSPNGYRWNWLEHRGLRWVYGLATLPLALVVGMIMGAVRNVGAHIEETL